MAKTTFTVTNTLTQATSQNVLVFTVPTQANPNYTFAAWQNLNISPNGGSQAFDFDINLSVVAVDQTTGSRSAMATIKANQVLLAEYSNLGGIGLTPATASTDTSRVTPDQSAVINATDRNGGKAILLATEWYINGKQAVRINNMNASAIATFELQPSLYFFAAVPTQTGFNYTYQLVSQQTKYVIPNPDATPSVDVTWYRQGGMAGADQFSFKPASA